MPTQRTSLIDPPVEELLDRVDSKFTLVALAAKRARQVNAYYNHLGEGFSSVVPPQVASVSGRPLTIAFQEVAAGKAEFRRPAPGEEGPASEGGDVDEGGASEAAAPADASAAQETEAAGPVDEGA